MNNIVVFNALQTSLSGGIGRYSYELVKELYLSNKRYIKIVIREQDKKLFEFANEKDLIIVDGIDNSKQRNFYEQFKLPKIVYNRFPDAILHYPDTMAPLFAKNKVIITVHDLAFKSLKSVFTWKTVLWKNIITNMSIKKASKIIAITNFTKGEIVKHYPRIDQDKISVVYNGFNDFSKEGIQEESIRDDIKLLNGNYILTVSTISPRKNMDALIKAFNLIKNDIEQDLVIAGNNGWMYEHIYTLVDELKLRNRVHFTGKVNDNELKFLYKNAKIFTYVSFYEGFGLPPLEAMSYNVPCIVSNTSSIPEVVGNAAMKVNPYNIDEIADAIMMNLNQKISCEIVQERLLKFSWKRSAEEVYEIYSGKM